MEKIVNPCKCKVYDMRCEIREVPAFVKIKYKEKKPGQKVLSDVYPNGYRLFQYTYTPICIMLIPLLVCCT